MYLGFYAEVSLFASISGVQEACRLFLYMSMVCVEYQTIQHVSACVSSTQAPSIVNQQSQRL